MCWFYIPPLYWICWFIPTASWLRIQDSVCIRLQYLQIIIIFLFQFECLLHFNLAWLLLIRYPVLCVSKSGKSEHPWLATDLRAKIFKLLLLGMMLYAVTCEYIVDALYYVKLYFFYTWFFKTFHHKNVRFCQWFLCIWDDNMNCISFY